MLNPNGSIRQTFQSVSLPIPGFWDHGIVVSCNQLYAGSLPNSSFKTPCHLWPEHGYKLAMRVTWDAGTRDEYSTNTGSADIDLK